MNKAVMNDLCRLLEEEINVYKQLYDLSNEENQLLIKNDLSTFQELIGKQEKFLIEIKTMNSVRERVMESLAKDLNIPLNDLSLVSLLEIANSEEKERLQQLDGEIKEMNSNLDKINKSNGILISNALKYLKFISKNEKRNSGSDLKNRSENSRNLDRMA